MWRKQREKKCTSTKRPRSRHAETKEGAAQQKYTEDETEQKEGREDGGGREGKGLQSPGAPVVVMRSHYQDTGPLGDAASGQGEEKKTKTEMREERRGKDERRRKPKVASEREKREQRRGNGTGR